jgi:hypothetical protein
MQTSEMAAQAVAVVALVTSGGVTVAQGGATRALGDLISVRLSSEEPGRQAWRDFQVDPYEDSLVCHLLEQELEWDSSFRDQFVRQLAQVSGATLPYEPPRPTVVAGRRGANPDAGSGSPIAGIAALVFARVRRAPSPELSDPIRPHCQYR